MSSTIQLQNLEQGQNISVEGNHLFLYIKGTHGDVQRINIDSLYMFFKEMFTTDWVANLNPKNKEDI